jgi:hypothetical protein
VNVPTVWIDFNDVQDGRACGLRRLVTDGPVSEGDAVVVRDLEGACYASGNVTKVGDTLVHVALGLGQ